MKTDTMLSMAKKGRPKSTGDNQNKPDSLESKTRPGFYLRLPEEYRPAVEAWQDKFKEKNKVKPGLVDAVTLALDEYLSKWGIDPKTYREPDDTK